MFKSVLYLPGTFGGSVALAATGAARSSEMSRAQSGATPAGAVIDAHGGGVLFHEGTYFWYGELKEGRTYLPQVNKSWGGTRVGPIISRRGSPDWAWAFWRRPALANSAVD